MSNQKTKGAVNWAVSVSESWAVWRAVSENVNWALDEAVTLGVNNAVSWAVFWAVNRAVEEDSPHPALQDFLGEVGETS